MHIFLIKEEIVEKCLQSKGKNIYEFISEFVGFKNDIITITEVINEVNKIIPLNKLFNIILLCYY